jgi:hypothetical protein
MSDESGEFEADELLRALGKVQAPEPGVLEDAREVLWSAVAEEMLGVGAAGDEGTAAPGEEGRRGTTRRRQKAPSPGERRTRMGGTDT